MQIVEFNLKSCLDEAEMLALANSADVESGRILLKAVALLRDKGRQVNENSPKIDGDKMNRDFRTVNGLIQTCNTILDLPRAARQIITKGDQK